MKENLITRKELCEKLKISYPTLYRYQKQGMPVIKVGKFYPKYDLDQVLEWMENYGKGK